MKRILIPVLLVTVSVSVKAQTGEPAGSIAAVKGGEIILRHEDMSHPLQMREKLRVFAGNTVIYLEVTFPMQTSSKCRIRAKDAGLTGVLKPGMRVYFVPNDAVLPKIRDKIKAGETVIYNLPGLNINDNLLVMKYVPIKKFNIGEDDNHREVILPNSFWIMESETTYLLWKTVYNWATKDLGNGKRQDGGPLYHFANPGDPGADVLKRYTSGHEDHPVTYINWRDAMIWCNALTEYCNANNGNDPDYDCVYYEDAGYTKPFRTVTNAIEVSDTPGSQDNPYIKSGKDGNFDMIACSAKGFRLLTGDEYEYASKYIADLNNDGDILDKDEFYPGNHVTGDISAPSKETTFESDFMWNGKNSGGQTNPVKKKKPNALGLYDMHGNVGEWCFGRKTFASKPECVYMGGFFWSVTGVIHVNTRSSYSPFKAVSFLGFRIARNQ